MIKQRIIQLLRSAKKHLLLQSSRLKAILYRRRGIRIGRHCVFSGRPIFTRKGGANIVLEDAVSLHSDFSCNRLITRPCLLSCVAPGAEIIMRRGSGMSGCTIVCSTRIEVGEHTMLGAGCTLYDCKEHDYRPESGWTFPPAKNEGRPITIGKRCYIGMNCVILKGVTIGDNCVISAGTIVDSDVPSGHLAKGNPMVFSPLPERLRTTPSGVIEI